MLWPMLGQSCENGDKVPKPFLNPIVLSVVAFMHGSPGIGELRIPGRPRTIACFCAKARLTRVTSHQEDK